MTVKEQNLLKNKTYESEVILDMSLKKWNCDFGYFFYLLIFIPDFDICLRNVFIIMVAFNKSSCTF
ncbi:hypothetical protein LX77_00596 [Gelidibacter algens]|uniref:Uncharacterized protein n=1 Tax=Gelidibacter algens TaxID=49280 RepID=A0A327SGR7_9FLAO|nr:hypothetical protein LX77_00596 [Gelidibacter algens]